MKKAHFSALIFLFVSATGGASTAEAAIGDACRPLGYDRTDLIELRESGFVIEDASQRQRFALELLDCLGNPDPVVRDQVAYEGFATLLRDNRLDADTIQALRVSLMEELRSADDRGFLQPFAALVLSEVARADRISPVFSSAERAELVTAAAAYMRGVDDYRGFDEASGWRHGVAHAADLLMQLALNPAVDRSQLEEIRDAIAVQIAPDSDHFYIYGESGRLARPILFIAMRDVFSPQEWADWFSAVASPGPFETWSDVFASQAGLARLHNTKAFLQVIYINASVSDDEALAPLQAAALDGLKRLP